MSDLMDAPNSEDISYVSQLIAVFIAGVVGGLIIRALGAVGVR